MEGGGYAGKFLACNERCASTYANSRMKAGRDRIEGKFDKWKEAEREQYWGKAKLEATENKENGKVDDEVEVTDDRVIKDSQASSEA